MKIRSINIHYLGSGLLCTPDSLYVVKDISYIVIIGSDTANNHCKKNGISYKSLGRTFKGNLKIYIS